MQKVSQEMGLSSNFGCLHHCGSLNASIHTSIISTNNAYARKIWYCLSLKSKLLDRLGIVPYPLEMDKKPKRPRDANQLAKFIVDVATGEAELPENKNDGKNPAAVALGKLGGKKGGKARAKSLTAEERSAIAKKAAKARWKNKDN